MQNPRTPRTTGSKGVLAESLNTCSYITILLLRNLSQQQSLWGAGAGSHGHQAQLVSLAGMSNVHKPPRSPPATVPCISESTADSAAELGLTSSLPELTHTHAPHLKPAGSWPI